jgi:hypothetical protein
MAKLMAKPRPPVGVRSDAQRTPIEDVERCRVRALISDVDRLIEALRTA